MKFSYRSKRNASGQCIAKSVQDEDTWFRVVQHGLGMVRSGHRAEGHMVKKFLDQKVRNRNFQARPDRTATGTPAKSRSERDSNIGERKQRDCYQWNAEGKCSKRDVCIFKHDASKRGKRENERETNRSPSPASKSPMRNWGKSFSKGGTLRGSCPSGRKFQKSCQKCLNETCTDPSGNFWYPTECPKYKTKAAVTVRRVPFHVQRRTNSHGTERQEVGFVYLRTSSFCRKVQ